jgi:hypothetical protein
VGESSGKFARLACADQTLKVVPDDGTRPRAIYLGDGNKVTWDANGHDFVVIFRKKSPFAGGKKRFDNKNNQSPAAQIGKELAVYNYEIIVDDAVAEDPPGVGGGG